MPDSPKPPPTVVFESAWMRVVSKRVALQPDAAPEDYFVVEAGDWAAICPRTADGRFACLCRVPSIPEDSLFSTEHLSN